MELASPAFNHTPYSLLVSNGVDSAVSSNANLTVLALAPAITNQPLSQTVLAGSNVTLKATATGSGPLAYQWLKDGATLSAAATNSYTILSAQLSDAGNYSLLVSNAAGLTAISSNATLTVVPLIITQQPLSCIIAAGYRASFAVAAIGPGSISYQWLKDGGVVSNTPTGSVTFSNIQYSDAGVYSVLVSNGSGSVSSSNAVLTVIPPYTFSTYAGVPGSPGTNDGRPGSARLHYPTGIAVDGSGNLYVSQYLNQTIRKIAPDGTVSTLAGVAGSAGTNDGVGSGARFSGPEGLSLDVATNLYVADNANSRVRKITPDGTVTTLATGVAPSSLVADSAGNIYIASWAFNKIQKATPDGQITLVAGSSSFSGWADGVGSQARFQGPDGIGLGTNGNLFVADQLNNAVRRIAPDGTVTTLAGKPGTSGWRDGCGNFAFFDSPYGGTVDGAGNFFMAGYHDSVVRRVTPDGMVTTVAGAAYSAGVIDGAGAAARFAGPGSRNGIAVDGMGNLFVADCANHVIRKGVPFAVTTLPQSQAVQAGSGVTLTALATAGTGPFSYQWLFAGMPLAGETNAALVIGSVWRTNSGVYSVVVSNGTGNWIALNATVRALVQPMAQTPMVATDGTLRLLFQDADGGLPYDLTKVIVQCRTNLPSGTDTNWQSITTGLYLTNGFVEFNDTNNAVAPSRFYRILEQ